MSPQVDLASAGELQVERLNSEKEVKRVTWTHFTTHLAGFLHPGFSLMLGLPADHSRIQTPAHNFQVGRGAHDVALFVRIVKSWPCKHI